MAQFYADENFEYPVVERLRVLGHDVLTVQEAGEQGGDDDHVLATAKAASRIVLTFDRRDFSRLHRKSLAHAGIISCTWDANSGALASRIDKTAATVGSLVGQHLRVNKPPKCRHSLWICSQNGRARMTLLETNGGRDSIIRFGDPCYRVASPLSVAPQPPPALTAKPLRARSRKRQAKA